MVTPCTVVTSPGTVSSQFPPVSAARSTITDPGRMASTAVAGISRGAGRPGTSAVVIDDVGVGDVLPPAAAAGCACCLRRERGRVAPRVLGPADVQSQLDERRAQALDLLLDHRPGVEGGDDGAQPAGGRDRLQARDPGAQHEHLGGGDGAGGGHEHREEPGQPLGGDDAPPCSRTRSPATRARPSAARGVTRGTDSMPKAVTPAAASDCTSSGSISGQT